MLIDRLLKRYARRVVEKVGEELDRRLAARLDEHGDRLIQRVAHCLRLERTLRAAAGQTPDQLFAGASDDYWLWLNTEGCRVSAELRGILPGLPADYYQLAVASLTGDGTLRQAFSVYALFRSLIEQHYGRLAACDALLDFGCGWGRVARFFLRDLPGERLWGIETWDEQVQQAKRTNRWSNFACIDRAPPAPFAPATFDVVFSYSVFSHLGEDLHRRWLSEFDRILKPGGLVIATTWGRDHIDFLERVKAGRTQSWDDHYNRAVATRFPGRDAVLARYDRGEFCHLDLGYAGNEDYGETMIPKRYVMDHWTGPFSLVDFIEERDRCPQNVIVVRKGA